MGEVLLLSDAASFMLRCFSSPLRVLSPSSRRSSSPSLVGLVSYWWGSAVDTGSSRKLFTLVNAALVAALG